MTGEHRSPSSKESVTAFTSDIEESDEEELSTQNADCNYANDRWVADRRRPLYSGSGCKQWLSGMWACRLTQRTDFSFKGYRWQPKNCKMKEFNRFSFLRRMRNKTIAFVGDSLGRQQFQSMMCMVSGGEEMPEVEDAAREYGLVKPRGAKRPDGWVYRFPSTNTTILYYWSASLSDLVPVNSIDKNSDIVMHLDRPPAFLRRCLHRFDILVLNTGHHWNSGKLELNRWVMHVNGKPNENKEFEDIRNAKNFTVHSFVRGSEVLQDESNGNVIESASRGTKVKILDVTAISELRDEAHVWLWYYANSAYQ
ncbi:Protein trichome birefringence-like 16 [Hibiscus syriacus]|uniref:Protein trichome birefringence-like 16 n=1 Tax=Hibiscus syriacus TaxID=106335 RepID=A0A6A3AVK1_HIBSY|nr:Protein trichome birefringence-like 16 [Hibiscus syriacus]